MPNKSLQDHGTGLIEELAFADTAVAAQSKAEQEQTDFHVSGARKVFTDKVNATRKSVFGELSKLQHEAKELNLPRDYAESFFRRRSTSAPEPTASQLERKMNQAEAQYLALKAAYEAKVAEEAEQEALRAKASREQKLAALKASEAELARQQAEIAALRAELDEEE